MARTLPLIFFLPILAYGAGECAVPPEALAKLRGLLSYESHNGLWSPGARFFSFAESDGDAFFLMHESPQYYDPRQRIVYAFRKGNHLFDATCPNNSQWPGCAQKYFREVVNEPADTVARLDLFSKN